MARNEEKAQSMLNRLLTSKQQEAREPKQKRPYLATEVHDVVEADKWRQQILREIGRKVMEIQNAGLGEHRIRDLNDEINKLIREKGHWEDRIVELGGPDYAKAAPKVQDSQGFEIQGATGKGAGYRYFGAAKQLPGVKELFEKDAPRQLRRTRHDMFKRINADYYGLRDEEDGVLEKVEAEAERNIRRRIMEEWQAKESERQAALSSVAGGVPIDEAAEPQYVAYVPLPDEKEIELRVVERKKAELLAKYSTPGLQKLQQDAIDLLAAN